MTYVAATSTAADRVAPWAALRLLATFIVLPLIALLTAGSAHAHGSGTHTGFQARVSYIEPQLPGLVVQVLGGHERLSVSNLTQKNVVILDARGGVQERIAPGRTNVWPEPRIGSKDPPPGREGLVRNWRITGEADGQRFEIVGFLGYRPPAGAKSGDDGTPAWLIVLAVTAGLVIAATALVLPHLRREDEGEAGRSETATER